MAQVPYNPISTVAPSTPTEYDSVPAATPNAFGAQVGQAEQQLGDNISHISKEMWASQLRVASREDAVERARDYGKFGEEATQQLLKLSTEGDLSRQDTVNSYREFVDNAKNKIVMEHRGSPESKLRLMEKLENDRVSMVGQAAALSVQAQQAMLQRNIGGNLSLLTGKAYENPSALPVLFQQLDEHLKDLSASLTPQEEALHRDGGRAKIAGTAIESFVARGDFDGAENVLQMPGVAEVIGTEAQNRMRGVILQSKLALRDARMKGIVEGEATRSKIRSLLGREPTNEEVALAAGVVPKEGAGLFGTGLTGRSLQILTEGAPAYAQGMLTPEQNRIFESALTQYRQPVTMLNPDTGMIETRRPEIPPFVREALRRQGVPVPQATPSNFPGGQRIDPATQAARDAQGIDMVAKGIIEDPTAVANIDASIAQAQDALKTAKPEQRGIIQQQLAANVRAKEVLAGGPPLNVSGGDTQRRASDQPQEKIWDMASRVAGPIAAGANLLGKTPIIGDLVNFPSYTQAKNFVPVLVNDLVKVLQNNPRFSEGERSQIRKEIELDPKAFDTPQSFRNRMIGVDKALALREKNAYETARSNEVSLEERRHAMNVFNGIVRFREALGVPPTVKSPEEARKLGPGATFLDPEGNVRRVP